MHARLRSALLAVTLLATRVATAEPLGPHFTVTPLWGVNVDDVNFSYPTVALPNNIVYMGGRLGYQYNSRLGFEAAGGFSPSAANAIIGGYAQYWHVSGNLMVSPWIGNSNPFLFVGGGYSRLQSGQSVNQGNLEYGGGFNLWLTTAVGVRLEVRDILWIPRYPTGNRNTLVLGGGLTFAVGGQFRDADLDGVPDNKDNCIHTPAGAKVDEKGCPLDSDGDKVFDGLDQCPDTPAGATVDSKGCPLDSDGDSVYDGLDQCADTPKGARVSAQGCPSDEDGDHVLDGIDKCPGTPKGAIVDATGCPTDSDGDGVFDGLDRCANTPQGAQVSVDGCPIEMIERETQLLDTGMIRLHDVNFETGKAELSPDSYAALDAVGQVLEMWPDLKVEVGGHTDARGPEAKNQALSEARAGAVLDYLTRKFPTLKQGQYTVRGYGESMPIAPNTSALNMAKNRRVEFVVLNKDVLKREVQKRRTLPHGENLDH